jgi:DNA polymerase/3'-5' exonuclease PolX
MDFTQAILEMLEVMRKKETATKEVFKAKAYATAAKNIQLLNKPIYSIDDLDGVKGVGDKIRAKILELMETGTVAAAQLPEGSLLVSELMKVHGIGPSKAKTLIETHGIRSIQSLEDNPHLLNDKQKIGLKYWRDFQERIPRKEMLIHQELLSNIIQGIDSDFVFQITGSFRRLESSSGDIDILITHKQDGEHDNIDQLFRAIIAGLKDNGYLTDTFAEGPKKCLGVCRMKRYKRFRRIDLLYTSKTEYPFALLYFTGNVDFNVAMRAYCLSKGYSLSEHGIKDDVSGKMIETGAHTEEDIFQFLKLNYVEPKDRKADAVLPLA